jgi:hypothetical protein
LSLTCCEEDAKPKPQHSNACGICCGNCIGVDLKSYKTFEFASSVINCIHLSLIDILARMQFLRIFVVLGFIAQFANTSPGCGGNNYAAPQVRSKYSPTKYLLII